MEEYIRRLNMKGSLKKVILSIFVILFILTTSPIQSYDGNNSFNRDMPLEELVINTKTKSDQIISVPLYFSDRNITFDRSNAGLEIKLIGCKNMNVPDLPAFPYFEKEIEFPSNEQLIYIKVKEVNTSKIELPKNIPLKLAPKPIPISAHEPNNSLSSIQDFQTKEYKNLNPYLYGSERMKLYSDIDNRNKFNNSSEYNTDLLTGNNTNSYYNYLNKYEGKFNQNIPEIFPDYNFDYVITSHKDGKKLSLFVNPIYYIRGELILAKYICLEIGLSKDELYTSSNGEENKNLSVILTPDEFFNEANKLKNIQESYSYKVSIVKLSSVLSYKEAEIPDLKPIIGYKDASEEEKAILKNYNYSLSRKILTYLKELLKDGKINYLTILGDGSKVPPSYYVLSSDNFSDYDKWVPTDIFYFAPDAKNKEYPIKISVGRLPVRDKEEAKIVVDKIDRYRKSLSDSWFKNIALMGGDPFGGDYMGELFLADLINKDYFEGLNVKKYFKTSGKFGKDDLLYCLENESFGFIDGHGHGGGDTYYLEPGTFNSKEALSLKKKDELPIFLSVACGNGAYDTMVLDTDFSTNKYLKYPTSFSESLVLGEGGAIAYVGGARINYSGWSLNYKNGVPILKEKYYMDVIFDYFFKHYHEKTKNLGDIVKLTLSTYADEEMGYINYADVKTFFGFTLLGDPTINLPLFSGDFKSKVPEISFDKEYRFSPSNLPLFPIDDGVQILSSTNSPILNYVLSDYLNAETPVLEEGTFGKGSKEIFSYNFNNLIKSVLTIRVETKDFKEMRIVFYGRYWHDLVVVEDYDLSRLSKGENKDYVAIIRNDGIYDEENITLTVKNNGKEMKKLTYNKLPYFQSRYVQYNYLANDVGSGNIEISTPSLKDEKVTSDNILLKKISVIEENIIRVGVLAQSSLLSWSDVSNALNILELNKRFNSSSLPIEIFPITFGRESFTNTTFLKRLNIDILILYTNDFFDFLLNQYLSEINEFIRNGGVVLGILSLGENSFGFSSKEIQPLFGLGKEEKFKLIELPESKETFKISDNEISDKDKLNITARFTLIPKDKNSWKEVSLEGGELVGISEDGLVGLIKYRNSLLYSGYFNWKDLTEDDDTYYFFESMLKFLMKEHRDLSVSNVTLSPTIGRKNNIAMLNITLRNCGNATIQDIGVLVNPLNKTFNIESLKGKEERKIKCEIDLRGVSERLNFEVIVDPNDKVREYDETNNKVKVCYNVLSQGEPDIEPELILNIPEQLEVTEPKLVVEGKTNFNATVSFMDENIAKNSDGSFSKIVNLNKGDNYLTFTAKEGSLKTVKNIKVVLKKLKEIQLKIGDRVAFLDSELKQLDEPPVILIGVTFVPLRFISEAFGAKVDWFKEENKIVISNKDITLIMWIGKDIAKLNDKEIKLGAKPFISKSGRTSVPLRIISEAFGAEVLWDAKNNTISIKLKVDFLEEDLKTSSLNMLKNGDEEMSSSLIINSSNPPEEVIFPSCFDLYNDEFYVTTYKGICVLDKDLNLKRRINYPSFLADNIDISYFRALTSSYSRNFLRVSGENLFFSDGYDIYIFDKESGELKNYISGYHYGNLIKPLCKFDSVYDFEIYDDKLFVLDSFQISVIDASTGELLSILSNFNYNFMVDFTIIKEYIYAVSLYDGYYKIGLDGENTKWIDFPESIIPSSIAVSEDGFLYLSCFYPDYTVLKLNANNGGLVKKFKISGNIGEVLDRMIIFDDFIFALSLNNRESSSYMFEEKFVKLDMNLKLLNKSGADGYNKVKSDRSFLINPEYVRITGDGNYLISQYYPLNPDYFKLYSEDCELIKAFMLSPPDGLFWIRRALELNNDSVGALFIDYVESKYCFKSFEPTSKGAIKTHSVELKPTAKYNYFYRLSYNDDLILTFDLYSGNIVEFNIKSGEEVGRFSLASVENCGGIYFPYSMKIVGDKVYIIDFVKKLARVYSLKGEIISDLDFNCYSESDKVKFYTDSKIIDEDEFAILDYELSNLLLFDSESLNKVIGEKRQILIENDEKAISNDLQSFYLPYSFDIKDNSLLINDLGNYRVIKRPLSYIRTEKEPLNIKITPENLNLVAYSKDIIEEEILVEVFGSDAPLEILSSPLWVNINKFDSKKRNSLIKIKLDPSVIAINKEESGTVTFKVGEYEKKITINIRRANNEITFYSNSSLIKSKAKNYFSKAPALLKNNIIFLSEDILTNIFDYDIKRTGEEILIFTDEFTVKLKVGGRKGNIILPTGTAEIDLGDVVQEKGGILLIPVNAIFNFLSVTYEVKGELINVFLT